MLLDGPLSSADAARLASLLLTDMERETDPYELSRQSSSLAALAGQLKASDAVPLTYRLVDAMEKEINPDRLSRLSYSLAALTRRLEPIESGRLAARGADRLGAAMERETNPDRLSHLGDSLTALAGRLEPAEAARLAERGAERLVTAIEKETDADRLSRLSYSLAALAGRLQLADAAPLAGRGAERLAMAMEKETDASRLSRLSYSLAALAWRLEPRAHQTRLFTLSYLLRNAIPGPPHDGEEEGELRRLVAALLQPLSKEELSEVLKGPSCVGEAQKLVLSELEQKLSEEFKRPIAFGGDLGKFVEQARSLGITNHATPADRPRLEDVRKELADLRQAAASKP
ncbi:MAG: hypothetical protein NTY19_27945 [Planctomycetota bacterium]|nr:hypothetical protein [Planctomycetota bacterium]